MARGCCRALKSKGIQEIFFLSLLGDRIDPTLKMIAREVGPPFVDTDPSQNRQIKISLGLRVMHVHALD
jgi:hypothetical protein